MDGKRLRLLLPVGIICLVGGTIGAGLTYRSMRTENLVHARTEDLAVPFADSAVSVSARFQPYAAGLHLIYLASGPAPGTGSGAGRNARSGRDCPDETFSRDLTLLDGIIDITVADAGAQVLLSRSVGPGDAAQFPRDRNGWVLVDSVMIPATRDSAWTLGLSYCPGTSGTPSCPWVVFLLPPQELEIGGFLGDRVKLLLSFGGLMVAGFFLIVTGGRQRK